MNMSKVKKIETVNILILLGLLLIYMITQSKIILSLMMCWVLSNCIIRGSIAMKKHKIWTFLCFIALGFSMVIDLLILFLVRDVI